MNETVSEKEKFVLMLTEMCDQLEELEAVLQSSFSGLRRQWYEKEIENLAESNRKLSSLEKRVDDPFVLAESNDCPPLQLQKQSVSLKFEWGF